MGENLLTLLMLILLQAVLGLDNLLYISLESKNAPKEKQKFVRATGIGIAIVFRIGLLFLLVNIISLFQDPIFGFENNKIITGEFNIHSLIVYAGGIFILYTAVKEIWHLIAEEKMDEHDHERKKSSVFNIILMIIIMNLVFSFDSILSAIALTDVLWIMIVAIVLGGVLMIWLSEKITIFLKKNKMFEVLGLFILFLVGVMLVTEAAHLSDLHLFGNEIKPLEKSTFYFIIVILIIIDAVQTRYKNKLTKSARMKKEKTAKKINSKQ